MKKNNKKILLITSSIVIIILLLIVIWYIAFLKQSVIGINLGYTDSALVSENTDKDVFYLTWVSNGIQNSGEYAEGIKEQIQFDIDNYNFPASASSVSRIRYDKILELQLNKYFPAVLELPLNYQIQQGDGITITVQPETFNIQCKAEEGEFYPPRCNGREVTATYQGNIAQCGELYGDIQIRLTCNINGNLPACESSKCQAFLDEGGKILADIYKIGYNPAECQSGEEKCDDINHISYICLNEVWSNQGQIIGKCGYIQTCQTGTILCSDGTCKADCSCVPDNLGASSICSDKSLINNCGQTIQGTKICPPPINWISIIIWSIIAIIAVLGAFLTVVIVRRKR